MEDYSGQDQFGELSEFYQTILGNGQLERPREVELGILATLSFLLTKI